MLEKSASSFQGPSVLVRSLRSSEAVEKRPALAENRPSNMMCLMALAHVSLRRRSTPAWASIGFLGCIKPFEHLQPTVGRKAYCPLQMIAKHPCGS